MTIKIKRHLLYTQYIKLFSNPISGIACEVDAYNRDQFVIPCCQNIRYSKSMIIKALEFWSDQIFKLYLKMSKLYNPLEPMKDMGEEIMKKYVDIDHLVQYIKTLPDSFLFSHRYIMSYDNDRHTQGMSLQLKILNTKYQQLIGPLRFQKGKMDPFTILQTPYGIQFTVFPNEHPYIRRQKIMEVGKTTKGNTFIIKG